MGHNIDFTELLGVPAKVKCPRCREVIDSLLEDYDIECGDSVNAVKVLGGPARMSFGINCPECNFDFIAVVPIGKMRIVKEKK